MGHCGLCGDASVLMLLRAQWAFILGEGLGRKSERCLPTDLLLPCSASKPTLLRKDKNPPHRTAGVPQQGGQGVSSNGGLHI